MRINLKVPYEEKDKAKSRGARWDSARKTWYVEDAEDLRPFLKWIPEHLQKPHQRATEKDFRVLPDISEGTAEEIQHLRSIMKE